ncbi:chloride channel protein [Loktanella sp. Alg231-35]|uniref:chloride channel protein n=1 Tax=Loktanella sp. Alg231-35 TaxID=1922220 RepID=UPI000D5568A5|nr:chloride channel protein [Loktanella sp. Alg231-35]
MLEQKSNSAPIGSAAYRNFAMTVSAVVIGLIVSLAAIAFVEVVIWLNNVLLVSPRTRVQFDGAGWLLAAATILVPTIGGLIVGGLLRMSPERRPLGPLDVIKSVQLALPPPTPKAGILSTLASLISLGFGASVGQYGPLVYLGSMAGSVLDRLSLRISNFSSIAMACGVAAAISTAFNAPIAGLVFAHEVILRHYSMQAFAPTTVAAATGYIVANVMFEREALFLVDFAGVQHGHEFALFALLGLLASFIAVAFMRLILRSATLAAKMPIGPMYRPAFAGLAVGLTALWLPDVMGVGNETLRFATIEGAFFTWELALLVTAKIALTAICIGFGFAGGVFSPALLIGILFGALCWMLVDATGLVVTSSVVPYAICGMMAVTSAVIGAPLTTILIVFELTRNYDLTIAAMVAVVFSNLVAYRVFGRSLFDVQLARRGIDLSHGRDRAWLSTQRVSDILDGNFVQCAPHCAVGNVSAQLHDTKWHEAFVLDATGVLVGVLDVLGYEGDLDDPVSAWMRPPALQFDDSTTLAEAMRALEGFAGDVIPIVETKTKRLLGVVTQATVIKSYLNAVRRLRREENATA